MFSDSRYFDLLLYQHQLLHHRHQKKLGLSRLLPWCRSPYSQDQNTRTARPQFLQVLTVPLEKAIIARSHRHNRLHQNFHSDIASRWKFTKLLSRPFWHNFGCVFAKIPRNLHRINVCCLHVHIHECTRKTE